MISSEWRFRRDVQAFQYLSSDGTCFSAMSGNRMANNTLLPLFFLGETIFSRGSFLRLELAHLLSREAKLP
jgi:hypothetical protein